MGHTETYVNGVLYPSVTTIISGQPKPWLDRWKERWGKRATRKTKIANAIGTEFHACVEASFAGTEKMAYVTDYPTTSRRCQGMVVAWKQWADSIVGEIEQTEMKVLNHTHTYSGTLDAVGTIEGKAMVIDWKTSSRIYPDMQLQLSAYAEAYKEMTGKKLEEGIIVHVSKKRPHKVTTKIFKLGKRVFNKFLKLRAGFDEVTKNAKNDDDI